MNIEQHIEELRAELKWCDDEEEITVMSCEIESGLAQKVRYESAIGMRISDTE